MKRAFLSRRHRNPHQHDEQQKEQPFFSKSNEKERQPFFPAASHEQPVQTKLAIGEPGDKYEKEADAVADHVANGQNQTAVVQRRDISAIQRSDLATPVEDEKLSTAESRMEKDKLIQEKPAAQMPSGSADMMEEKKKPVQMQSAGMPAMEDKKKKPVQMQTASTGAMEDKKKKPVQMAPASIGTTPEKKEKPVQMQSASAMEDKKKKPVQMQTASTDAMEDKKKKPVQMQSTSASAMEDKKKKPVQMQTASADAMEEEKKKSVQVQPASAEALADREDKRATMPLAQRLQLETDAGGTTASARLSSRIQDSSGKGKPLPGKTRAEMESAIGTDFSGVNIHTDASAVQMNQELGAQAFTHGRDVYFNSGKYRPESSDGKKLLAHELTHVVQQSGNDRVSLDRANTTNTSVGVKNTLKSSFTFSGSTKLRDALITMGDLNAAVKHGDCSLSELVIILNNNKFPQTGALIQGDRYNFQIASADATKLSIPKIKMIKKQ